MKKLALGFAFALAAVVAACSSTSDNTGSSGTSGTSGTTPEAGTPTGNNVTVKSNQFDPPTLTIKAGQTVTWTWAGGAHTVTSGANCTSDMAYGTGTVKTTVGDTFTHTYPTAGTFEYFCEPHCVSSGMKGTIIVQ
jgi:plastocyanin